MDDALRKMGQRIVSAARLAVAEHLAMELSDEMKRRFNFSGGAGLNYFKDDEPLLSDRPRRSSFFVERRAG